MAPSGRFVMNENYARACQKSRVICGGTLDELAQFMQTANAEISRIGVSARFWPELDRSMRVQKETKTPKRRGTWDSNPQPWLRRNRRDRDQLSHIGEPYHFVSKGTTLWFGQAKPTTRYHCANPPRREAKAQICHKICGNF
jgi:hypothetical protein